MNWLELWSFGIQTLGLPDEAFWALTPAQLYALTLRHQEKRRYYDYKVAMICALIANAFRDSKRRPNAYSPEDFMPKAKQPQGNIVSAIRRINTTLGGEVR